ncbi:hypothetical protein J3U64_09895 [Snodgrassella sp. B3800]|uniref:putative T6SS immunity periplasmic lipoprotein n=1 Tax=Snodgrassella sp. B3800 TaxID=2818039 RepID=UPI00226A0790|nr:putative T6SS immunity periplasmic lipoprotein [Snodgrassella sp. B3800]MCX8747767.1 hypothetical protein [Snodgrassella sp. B3800]
MNKNLFRILPLVLTITLITGCILHNNVFYTPEIALKKDGQPCISIPTNEDFFRRKKDFDISYLYVYQVGVGELWSKNYFHSAKPYYVQNDQCLIFNYHFQNNISYHIGFFSNEKGNEENNKSTDKEWMRYMQIIKEPDGTLQLLLDAEARDYS